MFYFLVLFDTESVMGVGRSLTDRTWVSGGLSNRDWAILGVSLKCFDAAHYLLLWAYDSHTNLL